MAEQSECLELRGEVGALIGSRDWSKTQLGPLETWPSSLKTMIGVMLGSRFPMMLGWGPDLLEFYNDAYVPVLGGKHPASLGCSGARRLVGDLGRRRPADAQRPLRWPGVVARARAAVHQQPRLRAGDVPHVLAEPRARRRRQGRRRPAHRPGDDRTSSGRATAARRCARSPNERPSRRPRRRPASSAASVLAGADADVPFSLVYLLGDDGTPTLAASSPASLAERIDLRARQPAGGRSTRRCAPVSPSPSTTSCAASVPCRAAVTASRPTRPSSSRCSRDERDRYGFVVFGLAAWRAASEGYLALPRARRLAARLGDRARPGRGGGATPRRGDGGARSRQDAVLQQHQPRAPHAADADARPHDGRAALARADPRGPRPRDRPPQRAPPAEARRQPARLRAHRGRPRPRVARAHPPRRPHRGAGPRLRLGHARGRPRVRGQLRAAAAPGPDRSGHVGEDPAEPDLERPQVHLRGEGARVAGRARRGDRARGRRHGHRHPRARAAARLRPVPPRRRRAGAHAGRVRHRAGAGARARAPAGRRRLGEERRGRGHDDDSRRFQRGRPTRSEARADAARARTTASSTRRAAGCRTGRPLPSTAAAAARPAAGAAPSGRLASWSWTTTPTCGSTWRACSPSTGRWRRPSTARPPSRQSARGAPTWCSRTS